MERRSHRRPPKHRMNRSVSEEVLDIQREMNEAHQGMRRTANTSSNMPGINTFSYLLQSITTHLSVVTFLWFCFTHSLLQGGQTSVGCVGRRKGIFNFPPVGGYGSFLKWPIDTWRTEFIFCIGNVDGTNSFPRNGHDGVKSSGHSRQHKPKRNKAKERLSRYWFSKIPFYYI